MTFSDHDIFGVTCKTSEVGAKETVQSNPTKSTLPDDPAPLMTAPSMLADESATLITTPSKSAGESVTLVTTPAVSADELADLNALPEATSDAGKAKGLEYPKWIKVHLSHLAASVRSVPPILGDLRWCWCNCSSSWRRAQHHLVEEQWAVKGNSSSASPWSSQEPAHHREEDPGAQPKALLLGFKEIAKSLTRVQTR